MAHRINIVLYPPSQHEALKGEVKPSPFAKATLYTENNESVHDRIGRFQASTDAARFDIAGITEVLDI